MSDIRASFPVLEDATTKEGVALTKSQQGEAGAAKVGLTALAFRDSAGNLVLPQLTSEGKLPVDLAGAGIPFSDAAQAPIAGSLTYAVVAELALTASKTYGRISYRGSCRRAAEFVLVQIDDATETVLDSMVLDAGQYNDNVNLGEPEFVTGGVGTQKLELRAKNFSAPLSDFRGSLACLEFAS